MNNRLKLVVGLGNPGAQYAATRHNAGENFVELLARRFSGELKQDSKHFGRTGQIQLGAQTVKLLIPETYMNRSGQSVGALAGFFKIEPQEILVAHDELDLPPGTNRLKFGGGHGGHNGLKSVIGSLGNSRDFYRLRIGIGHPGSANDVVDYVLRKAPVDEQIAVEQSMDRVIALAPDFADGKWEQAMKTLHTPLPTAATPENQDGLE
ncbi:MAG: aminoacyl-tRNA hydrolase [Pseudohongiellaceae bacterium]